MSMKRIAIYLRLSFFESLLALVCMLLIPGESGFSSARLGLIGLLCVIVFSFLYLNIKLRFDKGWVETVHLSFQKASPKLYWSSLIISSLGFLFSAFLLTQWLFISTDAFLLAYLIRLTPVLGFGLIACGQTVWLAFSYARIRSWHQDILMLIFGVLSILPGLLVGEYFLANQLFPRYFVAERYAAEFNLIVPVGLFIAALYLQVLFFYLRDQQNFQMRGRWVVAIALGVIGILFYNSTIDHATNVNTDTLRSDQQVYINFAKKVYGSNFSYTGDRNQTPLYPFIQALFYRSELTDQEFFTQGKLRNISLSIVLLGGLFFIFRRYFSMHRLLILTLIVAFSIFIFKSPYFTVENLYYFLSFVAFWGMASMLISPSIRVGIFTGIVVALAHYAKAMILPALAIFCCIFIVKELWMTFVSKQFQRIHFQNWISLAALVLSYLVILSPYLKESKEIYGRYFYNQNSTFFIWYDDFTTARADSEEFGYGKHWPDIPPDKRPCLQNYIRDHSLQDVVNRFECGIQAQFHYAANPYNGISYPLLYGFVLIGAMIANFQSSWRAIVKYRFVVSFVALFFIAYILVFAWYTPIAGGPRFIGCLLIPFMFSIFIVDEHQQITNLESKNGFRYSTLYKAIDISVLSLLIANFYIIITSKLPAGYFGS